MFLFYTALSFEMQDTFHSSPTAKCVREGWVIIGSRLCRQLCVTLPDTKWEKGTLSLSL